MWQSLHTYRVGSLTNALFGITASGWIGTTM